ncbi:MAG TPA: 2-oxoacid:acceptor oxidoreductase subunit alpha [Actinobacteria bacterium]|nr:2-oxoacid:acceptor oxidoreductase subunit alpha [Actinomycetota bacterium]
MAEARLLQGNQACALAAMAAGCRFFAGYPITPSSEIAEEMAHALPPGGGVFIQMEDEIASLAAVIGASVAGTKAMTATSGPGFSLMQEHIGYAAMIEAPCVIVNVMRGGPSTGLPTSPSQADVMQTRWGAHGDHPIIALAPASPEEIYHLTVEAFNLAERFRTPVVLTYDEVLGHLRERVVLPDRVDVVDRPRPAVPAARYRPYATGDGDVPALAPFGDGYLFHLTGLAHDERGYPTSDPATVAAMLERMHRKIDGHTEEIVTVERFMLDDAEVAVVAFGIVASAGRDAVLAARERGIRAGLVRLVTLWPFPDAALAQLAESVRVLLVAELNLGQVAREVTRAVAGRAAVAGHFRADGRPITPGELLGRLTALSSSSGGLA